MPWPEVVALDTGWEAACCEPDACATPDATGGLPWLPASVPGTAAAVLRDAGEWSPGAAHDFDAQDWWFRVRFDAAPVAAGERATLTFGGIATVFEVFLNGDPLLQGASMFELRSADVSDLLRGQNELAIRCRALGPLLAVPRKPRARWRQKVVDGNLRWSRTMLLGRAPGFAPGPAAVGPWRAVTLERARAASGLQAFDLRTRLRGADGVVSVRVCSAEPVRVLVDGHGAAAQAGGQGEWSADIVIPGVDRWWPHTHGEPALYDVRALGAGGEVLAERRAGFRELAAGSSSDHDVERDGLSLQINGVAVFARGAVWTPIDPVGLAPSAAELRAALEQARDAGLNLVRVAGTGAYESATFHDLCDELGMLVWQDFMFANLDYPIADADFRASVEAEAQTLLSGLGRRPSTVVLCGNSEIEQQVAMLGLDPALGRGELFGELLPALIAASGTDAIYVPSAPCGGSPPFRPDVGVANYFGVGGYRRPLEDARRAGVRFASECLAIANVPDAATLAKLGLATDGDLFDDPRWKRAVTSDDGTGWDFDDVRDHYLELLFGVDAVALRLADRERYLELSRSVSGEVMAEVFGEWRRAASPCGGGIVLWLRDLVPGAGWGLVDATGRPKVALHHLRRALAPVAVWLTDEGLSGIDAHVANDGPAPLRALLRVAVYREGEHCIADGETDVDVPAHGTASYGVEAIVGRFVDAAYAFRFGPPGHDTVVASLEDRDGAPVAPSAFRFPAGRPVTRLDRGALGLRGSVRPGDGGALVLEVASDRLAYGVRVDAPGFAPRDDAFCVEPGHPCRIPLDPLTAGARFVGGSLTALNLEGRAVIGAP